MSLIQKSISVDHLAAEELIKRRRLQLLVHSAIYYQFNDNLISDQQWSKWAQELVDLQKEYPDVASATIYSKEFSDFDPSTGYNLPFGNPNIQKTAMQLLQYHYTNIKGC